MTLSFATFFTGPMQAWSRLNFTLWRSAPPLPEADRAEVPPYLRRDLGLPPEAPPFLAPEKVTFL
ncbi:hypothetical protein [Vannielia litorea]|uniref:hypothetical protein n=1 Tax=Vannielia litorea TaxID=1217970 RepID=UPI001BCB3582|nr:hypothetical protein [Vannielia litorea]MBS8227165.1 hypothetical protein [Vannielia litorea]